MKRPKCSCGKFTPKWDNYSALSDYDVNQYKPICEECEYKIYNVLWGIVIVLLIVAVMM